MSKLDRQRNFCAGVFFALGGTLLSGPPFGGTRLPGPLRHVGSSTLFRRVRQARPL